MPDNKSGIKRKEYIPLHRTYLKTARNRLCYSIEAISRMLDISAIYYYQIESGKRGRKLSAELIIALSEILNIEPGEFLREESEYLIAFNKLNQIEKRNLW